MQPKTCRCSAAEEMSLLPTAAAFSGGTGAGDGGGLAAEAAFWRRNLWRKAGSRARFLLTRRLDRSRPGSTEDVKRKRQESSTHASALESVVFDAIAWTWNIDFNWINLKFEIYIFEFEISNCLNLKFRCLNLKSNCLKLKFNYLNCKFNI